MSSRKTINVAKMLYWANFQLARQDEVADQAYKQGICDMIEHIYTQRITTKALDTIMAKGLSQPKITTTTILDTTSYPIKSGINTSLRRDSDIQDKK